MATNNSVNCPDINGGTLPTATVTSSDLIIIQDVSDGNKIKTVPVSDVSIDPVAAAFAYAFVFGG
jgi:hypothetical protein